MPSLKPIVYIAILFFCSISLHAFVKPPKEGKNLMNSINGTFDVTMQPQQDDEFAVGRMTIDKVYKGDLTGTGKGQMLSHRTQVQGSAGYVAIEVFSGTVAGKSGSFVMMHTGTMDKGEPSLMINIVPDSATDELLGMTGNMTIDIEAGKHFYKLNYHLE